MRAVDTNVLARFVLRDDERQYALSRALFESNAVFVPITVALELEWVLRSYGLPRAQVVRTIRNLLGLPDVTFEDSDRLREALRLVDEGADFADAFHLVRCGECTDFVTFDKALAAAAPDSVTLLTA